MSCRTPRRTTIDRAVEAGRRWNSWFALGDTERREVFEDVIVGVREAGKRQLWTLRSVWKHLTEALRCGPLYPQSPPRGAAYGPTCASPMPREPKEQYRIPSYARAPAATLVYGEDEAESFLTP